MARLTSALGILVLLFIAYLLSEKRKRIDWKLVAAGTSVQIVLALLVLETTPGRALFAWFNDFIGAILSYSDLGSSFVFSAKLTDPEKFGDMVFAFRVLPTIIFFSALMSVLFYLGMKLLGTSGAETLSCTANIFVGQTEAPLLIKPYVAKMTRSELMTVMVGGFATVAGGVMAAYVVMLQPSFPTIAGHLMAASVMSAPAALVMAKIMVPETEEPETKGQLNTETPTEACNVIEAAAAGASEGVSLALNVAGMLIAFIAIVGLVDGAFHQFGVLLGQTSWSLEGLFAVLFYPVALAIGVAPQDAATAAQLLGQKVVLNEFYAYSQLGALLNSDPGALSDRTVTLLTYALCGFSNFASIGIQIAGIGGIAPSRRADLSKLGVRAMIAGNLACLQTACVVGVLIS